jgi:hypothetical protein
LNHFDKVDECQLVSQVWCLMRECRGFLWRCRCKILADNPIAWNWRIYIQSVERLWAREMLRKVSWNLYWKKYFNFFVAFLIFHVENILIFHLIETFFKFQTFIETLNSPQNKSLHHSLIQSKFFSRNFFFANLFQWNFNLQ